MRLANLRVGRRGTRVRQRFQKFIIDRQSDYLAIFERIHQGIQTLTQPNKKYNPSAATYDEEHKMRSWSIWKTSRLYYMYNINRHRVVEHFRLLRPDDFSVLRKKIKTQNSPPFIPDS